MRFLKPWRLIIYLILGVYVRNSVAWSFDLPETVRIKEGQSAMAALSPHLGWMERQRIKWAMRGNEALNTIQPGQYRFSGSVDAQTIIDTFIAWPTSSFERITILEWRNKRDVDALLVKAGLIEQWAYITFITDSSIIEKYTARYPFLREAGTITTLEGFLYPETYMIDPDKNVIDQLVYLQLEAFNDRIWSKWWSEMSKSTLWVYDALILASVIEKEERNDANKPLIASIFWNRIKADMRLDADITLCYGFQEPFETCTPSRIAQHLDDKTNPYNTRAVKWLPPTPISTVHVSSVAALFTAPQTDYLFYLHNNKGEIFPAKTNTEHNLNKSKEL